MEASFEVKIKVRQVSDWNTIFGETDRCLTETPHRLWRQDQCITETPSLETQTGVWLKYHPSRHWHVTVERVLQGKPVGISWKRYADLHLSIHWISPSSWRYILRSWPFIAFFEAWKLNWTFYKQINKNKTEHKTTVLIEMNIIILIMFYTFLTYK